MSHLDALLFARAHALGAAVPRASLRHRHLVSEPLAVVAFQLGAEPFSAAAIAFGTSGAPPSLAVAGDPRNRDLAFGALLEFARWFVPRFEAPASDTVAFERRDGRSERVATDAPQVVVLNEGTLGLLQRLGRRLAYLPTSGKWAADPLLVRLGRHLQFLAAHAATPGQQLALVLSDLVRQRWITPQSDVERMSLAAMDAFVDPDRAGGWKAAQRAEHLPVGPLPGLVAGPAGYRNMDDLLVPHLDAFLEARREGRDPALALARIERHYRRFVGPAWALLWKVHGREARVPVAPSASRRWLADRRAYTSHVWWTSADRGRRTRQTPRQAVRTLWSLEAATERLEAEQACEDPLLLLPYLVDGRAVRGRVVAVDAERKAVATVRLAIRPRVVLEVDGPVRMPLGRELWWARHPDDHGFVLTAIEPARRVTRLTLDAVGPARCLPAVGECVDFSPLHLGHDRWAPLPPDEPWTHRAPVTALEEES